MEISELLEDQIISGRYRLICELGSGSFGAVWKAEDTHDPSCSIRDRLVAIKICLANSFSNSEIAKEYVAEYKKYKDLKHENILTANTFGFDNRGIHYLVMDLCERGSLKKIIFGDNKSDPSAPTVPNLGEPSIRDIACQVANGLSFLHAQSRPVIHSDLKPDNILLDEEGHYRIADFGISIKTRSSLRSTMRKADPKGWTVAYAAPEMLNGEASPASDIFSFGAMLFEICQRALPWGGNGGFAVGPQTQALTINKKYSPELQHLYLRCAGGQVATCIMRMTHSDTIDCHVRCLLIHISASMTIRLL